MLDLYVFGEARRLEMADLDRRLERRARWAERRGWDNRVGTENNCGRGTRVLVNDPWSLEQMVRVVGEQRRAEAEQHRLAMLARGPRRSARVVVAQALRAVASRLDGERASAPAADRGLVGA